jgi:hypothetical protein
LNENELKNNIENNNTDEYNIKENSKYNEEQEKEIELTSIENKKIKYEIIKNINENIIKLKTIKNEKINSEILNPMNSETDDKIKRKKKFGIDLSIFSKNKSKTEFSEKITNNHSNFMLDQDNDLFTSEKKDTSSDQSSDDESDNVDEDEKILKLKTLKKLYNNSSKEIKCLISKLILSSGEKEKQSFEEIEKEFLKYIENNKNDNFLSSMEVFNQELKSIEKIRSKFEKSGDFKLNLNESDIKFFCLDIIDNLIDKDELKKWDNPKNITRFKKFHNIFV